jgi:hypothetical protein
MSTYGHLAISMGWWVILADPLGSPTLMQTLRVSGYDMAYLEVGEGAPLVCVHGTLGDFRTWSAVLGPLSRRHDIA